MTIISDLPWDLVEEIFSRVPIPSLKAVGSTCKRWNSLSKDERFTKKHLGKATKEYMITMSYESFMSTTTRRFNLHNIKDFSKEIGGMLCRVDISEIYQWEGLFLLVTIESSRLVVWNPYLGQTRWIEPNNYHRSYSMGYDNKNNLKVLWLLCGYNTVKQEIYDFKSNSWRVLDIIPRFYIWLTRGVSLKGNAYFLGRNSSEDFLICFDFTTERFGPRIHLPFDLDYNVILSCVREEQLAVLCCKCRNIYEMEIWITTKIKPIAVSWSKFLKVDIDHFDICPLCDDKYFLVESFFIEKEKKIAVICGVERVKDERKERSIMVGEDGYSKQMDQIRNVFSYVPSSVQIQ